MNQSAGPLAALLGPLLIGGLIAFVVFLISREFFCWYWKINEMVGLLSDVRDLLGRASSTAAAASVSAPAAPAAAASTTCLRCAKTFPGNLKGQYCEDCGARL
jgi:hypothetical protein